MSDFITEFNFLAGLKKPTLLEYKGNGVMVALFVPKEIAHKIALKTDDAEPAEDLHITLCYLGKSSQLAFDDLRAAARITSDIAKTQPILSGSLGGYGRFSASNTSGGKDVLYASVDIEGLSSLRQKLTQKLLQVGLPVQRANSYVPHVTLSYIPIHKKQLPFYRFEPIDIKLDTISLTVGAGNTGRYDFELQG